MSSINRITGVLKQELFITKASLEVIFDLVFFPLINIVVFGFVSLWLAGSSTKEAYYLLSGMILWQMVYIGQYSITIGALWNIWSRNMSNMFVSPLSIKEYIVALMISGLLKTLIIFILTGVLSIFVFKFNIFDYGLLNLSLYFVNLTLFAWALGIVLLGVVFRFGTRIQALAWGVAYLLQPLTAAFYPVKILPGFLQTIAYLLPPTYIFEAARINLVDPSVQWNLMSVSFIQNVVYFILSVWIFTILFKQSRETGQFAKNDT
ncbi:MAG: ABC transporter permease [bacterium]|nr:ABC transporter permease [bacterium]